jgi:hypothetical protein
MVWVRVDGVVLDEFRLGVAGVDGFIVGARTGHDLAAVDGEGGEEEGAVAGEGVGAVLPLEEG